MPDNNTRNYITLANRAAQNYKVNSSINLHRSPENSLSQSEAVGARRAVPESQITSKPQPIPTTTREEKHGQKHGLRLQTAAPFLKSSLLDCTPFLPPSNPPIDPFPIGVFAPASAASGLPGTPRLDGCLNAKPTATCSPLPRGNHDHSPINISASDLFTTTLQGGTGIPFDDTPSDTKRHHIAKIALHFNGDIRAIEVECRAIYVVSFSF